MAYLSNDKINKLCMSGIYKCDPMLEKLPSYMRDNPYWCHNWTFRVAEDNGDYYMWDTYWGNNFCILLTDDNFEKFEFLFDSNEVEFYRGSHWDEYPDNQKWRVRLDSGGNTNPKLLIKHGAKPVKERVVKRLLEEIKSLENQVEDKKRSLTLVNNDKVDLRYV